MSANGSLAKNSVKNLLGMVYFPSLSLKEQIEIKNCGRHTPNLIIKQEGTNRGKKYMRSFKSSIYEKFEWMCGCDEKNAIFCFPCLLFGGENSWSKRGVTDLAHVHVFAKRHDATSTHIRNVLSLAMLGKSSIQTYLSDVYRQSVVEHNEKVSNNRYILSVIINCIRFCGVFSLPLGGHDEAESAESPGVLQDLVNFSAELDKSLKSYLDKATVFKGTPNTIQNELLQCMMDVYQQEVASEIKEANFLSLISDETTDVSNICQLSLVYRYTVSGKPVERFWSFYNLDDHTADTIASLIKKEVLHHLKETRQKLISQSYDGAAVMSGACGGVQAKIKVDFPNAHYIHCYAHQLNLIMTQACSSNRAVRIFFANLSGLCSFFSQSTHATRILDEIVGRRLPKTSATRWNFNSRSVKVVYEHMDGLLECLDNIIFNDNIKTHTAIDKATSYKRTLSDSSFLHWLKFFHDVFPHVDILYNQIQNRLFDHIIFKCAVGNFENAMQMLRNKTTYSYSTSGPSQTKRLQTDLSYHREEKEILDIILFQTKERFKFTSHLLASNLFLSDKFMEYEFNFPSDVIDQIKASFPCLNIAKLHSELEILYTRQEFRNLCGVVSLLAFFKSNNLETNFSEICQLLDALITIPMLTAEAERSFPTLRRIKTFLRSTMSEDCLSALAILCIERKFISSIPNFITKVIDKFASQKNRQLDFIYKL